MYTSSFKEINLDFFLENVQFELSYISDAEMIESRK